MRHHRCSRRGAPSWHRELTQACCLSMIALLLVPLLTAAHGTRRLLGPKPGLKLSSERCHQEITGCSVCIERKGAVAAGAQFPGMQGPPETVSIITCQRCRPPYTLNLANGNCDCGKNSGSAFANGTLIRVDVFEPAKRDPATLSDVFPPGSIDSTASTASSSIKAESGAITAATEGAGPVAATTVSFSSVGSLDSPDDEKTPQQKQAALRRRFVSYLRNQGYDIQASRGTLILSRQPRATLFSADSATGLEPSPATTEAPQPLICVPCKPSTASIGGMIGGSFCMPLGKN